MHPCLSLPGKLRLLDETSAKVSFYVNLSGCSYPHPPILPPFPLLLFLIDVESWVSHCLLGPECWLKPCLLWNFLEVS